MFWNWASDFVAPEMVVRGGQDSLWNALFLTPLEGRRGIPGHAYVARVAFYPIASISAYEYIVERVRRFNF